MTKKIMRDTQNILNLPARFSISRTSGNRGEFATFRITDEVSGVLIVELRADILEFGQAILGLSEQPCDVEVYVGGNLGMKAENKTEVVPFDSTKVSRKRDDNDEDSRDHPLVREALAPFEVDGWSARVSDLFNGHRTIYRKGADDDGERSQSVTFFRHVPATPEDLAAARARNNERRRLQRTEAVNA